jgi:hypothetical protein
MAKPNILIKRIWLLFVIAGLFGFLNPGYASAAEQKNADRLSYRAEQSLTQWVTPRVELSSVHRGAPSTVSIPNDRS